MSFNREWQERQAAGAGEPAPRRYYYLRCAKCGGKFHTDLNCCPYCGQQSANDTVSMGVSADEADACFCVPLNSAETCTRCELYKRGSACKKAWYGGPCWGTGRGSCAACRASEPSRHECCQRKLRQMGPPPSREEILRMLEAGARAQRAASGVLDKA